MKWVLSQQSLEHHRWLLQDASQQAQFTYNSIYQSIRLKSKISRLFFLEVAGVFHKKILLRSEYGVVVGETQWTSQKEFLLMIDAHKLYVRLEEQTMSFLDRNKSTQTSLRIEPILHLDRKELFAIVFSSAWLLYGNANSLKSENLLVA